MVKTTKLLLLIGTIVLTAACGKRIPVTKWHNPNAIGPYSVLVNRPDGTAYIFNPQNREIEEEPNRKVGLAKLPPMDLTREVNPPEPQLPRVPK